MVTLKWRDIAPRCIIASPSALKLRNNAKYHQHKSQWTTADLHGPLLDSAQLLWQDHRPCHRLFQLPPLKQECIGTYICWKSKSQNDYTYHGQQLKSLKENLTRLTVLSRRTMCLDYFEMVNCIWFLQEQFLQEHCNCWFFKEFFIFFK